jgi:deazaflavin-dependent oxidoreductase (nitroreductase family)
MAAHPIHPPRGLSRVIWRLPIALFRLRLGWLFGNHFLLLTHTGRKSGQPRYAALEVMRYERAADTYIVASGFGEKGDWFLNLQNMPRAKIQVGFRQLQVEARRLPQVEAEREVLEYGRYHPIILRMLTRIVGVPFDGTEEGLRILTRSVPIVAFSPRNK